jgi:hypothetical protein
MSLAKRMLLFSGVGAAIGFLICSIFGQSGVSLIFGSVGGTFSCKTDVEHALQQFVRLQLYSALSGAVLLPLLIWLIRRAVGKRKSKQIPAGAVTRAGE